MPRTALWRHYDLLRVRDVWSYMREQHLQSSHRSDSNVLERNMRLFVHRQHADEVWYCMCRSEDRSQKLQRLQQSLSDREIWRWRNSNVLSRCVWPVM